MRCYRTYHRAARAATPGRRARLALLRPAWIFGEHFRNGCVDIGLELPRRRVDRLVLAQAQQPAPGLRFEHVDDERADGNLWAGSAGIGLRFQIDVRAL